MGVVGGSFEHNHKHWNGKQAEIHYLSAVFYVNEADIKSKFFTEFLSHTKVDRMPMIFTLNLHAKMGRLSFISSRSNGD